MEKLKKEELKGTPPQISSNFNLLEAKFNKLILSFNKLKNNINANINLNLYTKFKLLSQNIDYLCNEIDNINLTENKWTLTDDDIEQINCNMETKDLLKKFLPLMILYKLSNTT